ncbi:MAG: FadR family transcriptional regulator [Geminicoccaceae bacterium]|nr:FadR family transcriptional regulator [Geminicoccaceae bacterium]
MLDPAAAHTLNQLRAWLAREAAVDSRLPPERTLAAMLGVSRPALRKALATLAAEGQIWRHVGKGTYIGTRPIDGLADVAALARRTSPAEIIEARLVLEPPVAAIAAVQATPAHLVELRACLKAARAATTWRGYEAQDNRLHRTVASAAQNALLLGLLDTLAAVRRAVVWGRPRERALPPADHHSFAEHEAIVAGIAERDGEAAAMAMRAHLESVARRLLGPSATTRAGGLPAATDGLRYAD